jgi:hypothetical protein
MPRFAGVVMLTPLLQQERKPNNLRRWLVAIEQRSRLPKAPRGLGREPMRLPLANADR